MSEKKIINIGKDNEYKVNTICNKVIQACREIDKVLEERAIEEVKKFNQENRFRDCGTLNNSIDIVLNLLFKKDKVIDLMVKEIATTGKSIEIINLYNNASPDKPIYDLIKEHFYKKVEEENE